ncbi:ABC transporter substrate-binding protein [Tessaracoccus sp. MC1865]|uniref:ABC transporter substrate-binding protein n=1 Tax=Tessaracoccus sp. MC1865 TaxID=2760310 RepID=UPI0015FF88B8|nr:ABC transporter substrate-binding protein [Tessaracoccus sp. MC1865]MBB1482613.1 ABC transporter substrate-binding protein [Tessaracoccus sp. MC1865]QTO37936.1 ABC transporter substrate-binding protein [Tessaracoccus sp. MC1865]
MKLSKIPGAPLVAMATVAALALSACAGGATGDSGDGPIVMGLDTALSGAIGELGEQNQRGIELFLEELNDGGGVLDRQVELITRDNAADPATATTNVRNLITDDEVVGLFGPVSSATGVAQSTLATQMEIPLINTIANDIALTTTDYSDWVFQFVPNTHMEATAVAEYVIKANEGKTGLKVATIAPDYNQGRTTVGEFGARIEEAGVGEVVNSQFPALGTTDFSSEITAILSSDPDIVFAVISGADLVTWTRQAESYGLFDQAEVVAPYGWNLLEVLGEDIPDGVVTYARAPFHAMDDAAVQEFAQKYHEKYEEWPTDWSLLGYSGAQLWAQAVEEAGSVEPQAVRDSLAGITADTLLGDISFRECDHQASLPEYVGKLSPEVNPDYGFKTFEDVMVVEADSVMLTCEQAEENR